MKFLALLLFISSLCFVLVEKPCSRKPAGELLGDYDDLKKRVEASQKETVFQRFWKTFNNRIPGEGKRLVELNEEKDESGSFEDVTKRDEFRNVQRNFYTNLIENQFKFIEQEAKKDPKIKKAAESVQKNISPEVEKEVGGFKFKTKADLLRGFASLKMDSSWVKSEARYRLNGAEGLEFFVFKNFESFFIPIHTEFCYRTGRKTLESKINAHFTQNLSFNVIHNLGRDSNGTYVLQFDTRF